MLRMSFTIVLLLLLAACSQQPVISDEMSRFEGSMPANFSGSWQRNYARDDEVNAVLRDAYNRLIRTLPDQRHPAGSGADPSASKQMDSLLALARLAELITRPDVLTISQTKHEISIARKDDFAMLCAFFDGVAKAVENDNGTEICGWDGRQLVSNLVLQGGLQVTHRFTISTDGQQMRVVTTVSSTTSRIPFTLRRFYSKFERPTSGFNCIETFSMKRVCSTTEIVR
jgi:hypothetical protein